MIIFLGLKLRFLDWAEFGNIPIEHNKGGQNLCDTVDVKIDIRNLIVQLEVENTQLRKTEERLLVSLRRSKEERRMEKRKFNNIFKEMVERMVSEETRVEKVGFASQNFIN